MIQCFLQYQQEANPRPMAARMRSDQGGGQKDDAPSKPARSSLDGEAGEPIIGLKVFVVVVKLWELYGSYCKRIREEEEREE